MARYRMISYDVWGNSKDGFWVNQSFYTNTYIDIEDYYSDYRINRILGVKGIVYDWHESEIYAHSKKNGKPLFELRLWNDE